MFDNYICALDIGTSKIAAALVRMHKGKVESLFLEQLPAEGFKKGAVTNSIALTACISQALKNLKSKSGINIKFIHTAVSGQDITAKHSRAIIPLTERGNKVITSSDIRNVDEQARLLGADLEDEVIYQTSTGYTIDSQANIASPLGLYSHRLEVDLYLVCAKLSSLQSLIRAVNQAGYEIKDLYFSGIATSKAAFYEGFKKGINIFCDIGSDISEILIFREGILSHIEIIDVGGNDLTARIAESLKISFDLAEDLKRSHAFIGDAGHIALDKEILIRKNNLYLPIKQRTVTELATASGRQICQRIKESLEKLVSAPEVDSFVVCGRTALLDGLLETMENTLNMPVKLARLSDPQWLSWLKKDQDLSGLKYLTYLTSLGIISQVLSQQQPKIFSFKHPARNPIIGAINKVKEVYQEYF